MSESIKCKHCNCDITSELQSPEIEVCVVCFIYIEDFLREQIESERAQIIAREIALDAGCPELQGYEL